MCYLQMLPNPENIVSRIHLGVRPGEFFANNVIFAFKHLRFILLPPRQGYLGLETWTKRALMRKTRRFEEMGILFHDSYNLGDQEEVCSEVGVLAIL